MASDDEQRKANMAKLVIQADQQKTRVCWLCFVAAALACVILGVYLAERLMT